MGDANYFFILFNILINTCARLQGSGTHWHPHTLLSLSFALGPHAVIAMLHIVFPKHSHFPDLVCSVFNFSNGANRFLMQVHFLCKF